MKYSPSWQPLGQALADYHLGQRASSIIVRSSVEQDRHVPVDIFYKEALHFPFLEKQGLRRCRGRVLDIGAGGGAHTLWLQKKKLDVTAVDISPQVVEVMRARGVKKAVCADILSYDFREKFDTLLLMMNGIGIGGDLPGLERFLKKCREMLLPGGQILFDTTDISYVKPETRAFAQLHPPQPAYYGTVQYQLIYKNTFSEPYSWLYIDRNTMRQMAEGMGYRMEICAEKKEQYLASLTLH